MGSDRKRSMMPLLRSSHMPMAVVTEAKATVCAKMPGSRNSRYEPPSGRGMAPPKTNAKSSTKMIDCRMAKMASSGMRGMRLRFRQVMTSASATACRTPPLGVGADMATSLTVIQHSWQRRAQLPCRWLVARPRVLSTPGRRRPAWVAASRCHRWQWRPRRDRGRPGRGAAHHL